MSDKTDPTTSAAKQAIIDKRSGAGTKYASPQIRNRCIDAGMIGLFKTQGSNNLYEPKSDGKEKKQGRRSKAGFTLARGCLNRILLHT